MLHRPYSTKGWNIIAEAITPLAPTQKSGESMCSASEHNLISCDKVKWATVNIKNPPFTFPVVRIPEKYSNKRWSTT